ncbi:transcription elongation factor SPT6 homolog isoform X2 [Anneissia japonica]|uniref:transcription elongation factor SPT6 homolog isoform X2 n=1 Tax=Anneissia japonica TaxID=1529436 RepID=UPI001425B170|nr:transcription elongation factor SPT6 homolog isoform X2 [Anneissia japonica]
MNRVAVIILAVGLFVSLIEAKPYYKLFKKSGPNGGKRGPHGGNAVGSNSKSAEDASGDKSGQLGGNAGGRSSSEDDGIGNESPSSWSWSTWWNNLKSSYPASWSSWWNNLESSYPASWSSWWNNLGNVNKKAISIVARGKKVKKATAKKSLLMKALAHNKALARKRLVA